MELLPAFLSFKVVLLAVCPWGLLQGLEVLVKSFIKLTFYGFVVASSEYVP